jgi:hypothetical protein
MADTAKKTKATATATATPRQASTKKEKAAEVAKPTATPRKGIELVAKVEAPKKTKAVAKPRKTATKKENVVAISQPKFVSREMIEQVAYQFWAQRGYQHGHALEDWIKAEQELLGRASQSSTANAGVGCFPSRCPRSEFPVDYVQSVANVRQRSYTLGLKNFG